MFWEPLVVFLIGGFLGFFIEAINLSIHQHHLAGKNDAVLHIPFLPIYGFGAITIFLLRPFLSQNLFLQFLILGFSLSLLELLAGVFSTHWFKRRLWSYRSRWNIAGHTDFFHFFLWGVLGFVFVHLLPV